MICDNNAMDIKLMNQSEALWGQFLQKFNVNGIIFRLTKNRL